MAVKPIPEGYHTVTPYLVVKGAAKLIDFMKEAFGAEEMFRMGGPDGKVGHAELRIGDSMIMLADAPDDPGPMPSTVMLYVDGCDAVYKRALGAGAKTEREPADQFYGDRSAGVIDPSGNRWWIHTHIEDVPPEDMEKRAAAAMQQ